MECTQLSESDGIRELVEVQPACLLLTFSFVVVNVCFFVFVFAKEFSSQLVKKVVCNGKRGVVRFYFFLWVGAEGKRGAVI